MWSHNRLHVTRNDMGRSLLGIGQNPENPARWSRKSSVLFGCPPLSTEGSLHQLRLGISTTHFMDIVVIDWHIVYIQEESGCGKNLWVEIFLGYKTSNLLYPRRSEKIGYPPWHIQIRLAMLFPQTFCANTTWMHHPSCCCGAIIW